MQAIVGGGCSRRTIERVEGEKEKSAKVAWAVGQRIMEALAVSRISLLRFIAIVGSGT